MQTIMYDGYKFTRPNSNCYYRATTSTKDGTRQRLHQYVWEKYNGDIPKGYEIHHKDRDKGNNKPSNLELLKSKVHRQLHALEERNMFISDVIPMGTEAAKKWHKSIEGREWFSNQSKEMWKEKPKVNKICTVCGKVYQTSFCAKTKSKYCSKICKDKHTSEYRKELRRQRSLCQK